MRERQGPDKEPILSTVSTATSPGRDCASGLSSFIKDGGGVPVSWSLSTQAKAMQQQKAWRSDFLRWKRDIGLLVAPTMIIPVLEALSQEDQHAVIPTAEPPWRHLTRNQWQQEEEETSPTYTNTHTQLKYQWLGILLRLALGSALSPGLRQSHPFQHSGQLLIGSPRRGVLGWTRNHHVKLLPPPSWCLAGAWLAIGPR